MDLRLSGKRALVTGSTAGIGEAIARRFAAEGASVAIHGRDEARGNQLVDELKRGGTPAAFMKADLNVPDDIVALAEQTRTTLGGVDVLVNNAAVYPQHTWFESSADEWTRLYAVNVVASVRLIQLLVPDMKRAGWGRVVFISSGEASRPFAHMPGYAATKAAINNATSSLCLALAGSGVTVNAVSAGLIRTAEVERWFYAEAKARGWRDDWDEIEANILKSYLPVPVGHIGNPDDVARVVAFLASSVFLASFAFQACSFNHATSLRLESITYGYRLIEIAAIVISPPICRDHLRARCPRAGALWTSAFQYKPLHRDRDAGHPIPSGSAVA